MRLSPRISYKSVEDAQRTHTTAPKNIVPTSLRDWIPLRSTATANIHSLRWSMLGGSGWWELGKEWGTKTGHPPLPIVH